MKTNTRPLVFGALCIALSFALSFIRLFSMPMGGSVTLCSMLPLMLYAYRYGLRRGLVAGLAYGLLQLVQKPELVHWAQLLLDYPLAFAALGLAALTRPPERRGDSGAPPAPGERAHGWRLPLGVLLAGAARTLCHVVSGAVFFGAYAPEGVSAWWYSLSYNGSYLAVDTLLCLLVGAVPAVRRVFFRYAQ
ncbi:MAG: energy-coupled thiamine transporter ThiT [Clostridia bacterium]|nr:energy-coupled thiamine transporter ThiT [Clostridia bacterium]